MDPVLGAIVIAGISTTGKASAELVTGLVGKILGPSCTLQ